MSDTSPAPHRRSPRGKLHDDQVLERLRLGLRAGLYREEAAIGAGISPSTFYRWMKEGEAHYLAELESYAAHEGPEEEWEPPEPSRQRQVWETVKEAEATAELAMVGVIRKAATGSEDVAPTWQAAAWWLERKMPTKWGRKQRIDLEHSGEVAVPGEPRQVAPSSDEERLAIAALLDGAGALDVTEEEEEQDA